MRLSVRLLLSSVVIFAALALNACSGVQAASSGSGTGLNDVSLTVISTTSPDSTDVVETATPDVSETPSGTETPSASETPDPNELVGTVTAIDATTITINGVVYQLADLPAFAASLKVGDTVKVEFVTNANGTVTIREITISSGLDSLNNSNESNFNGNENSSNINGNSNSNSNESQNSNSSEDKHHGGDTIAPIEPTMAP